MRTWHLVFVVLMICLAMGAATATANYDFGGETVTLVAWGDQPFFAEFGESGQSAGRKEEAEELFNCSIEFVGFGFGEYPEQFMTRLLSGDSANDVWLMQGRHFWTILPQGAFYPIGDVLSSEYYEGLPALSRSLAQALTYRGQTYGFGVDYQAVHPIIFTLYNRDMFEREGLPDPLELYENDEWTWDAFTDLAIQATRDTTGDGSIDQWGTGGRITWAEMGYWLGFSNGAEVTVEDEDGSIRFVFNSEQAFEAVQQVYEWREVHQVTGGDRWQDFADGRVGMIIDGIYVANMVNQEMEERFGIIPLPKGPRATEYVYPNTALISWVLPANSRHPEGMAELMSHLFPADEYYDRLPHYIAERVRDRNSARIMMEGHDGWSGQSFDLEYAIGGPLREAINEALLGYMGPAAAIAERQPQIQAAIDELFNQ